MHPPGSASLCQGARRSRSAFLRWQLAPQVDRLASMDSTVIAKTGPVQSTAAPGVQFLVAGMARSGTTVAQRLLSEVPGVRVAPETHFWRHAAALARHHPFPIGRAEAEEALAWFAALPSSEHLDLDPHQTAKRLDREVYVWDIFVAVVEAVTPECAHATAIGESTPDHLRWSEQLLQAVPSLRMIGVVRDPREVFRSQLSVPWGVHDPRRFAEKWLDLSRRLRDVERLFPGRVFAVRYEDMLADPVGFRTHAGLLLGLGLEHRASANRPPDGLFSQGAWQESQAPRIVGPRDSDSRWEEALDEAVVAEIEATCGSDMEAWRYGTVTSGCIRYDDEIEARLMERRTSDRISATHLPINAAWTENEIVRSYAMSSSVLHSTEAQNRMKNDRLVRQLVAAQQLAKALESERDCWREQAEHLVREERRVLAQVEAEKLQRVKAERRRLVAEGKLQRIKGRRWWRLGEALSALRRKPISPKSVLQVVRVLAKRQPLPSLPDLGLLDQRIGQMGTRAMVDHMSNDDTIIQSRAMLAEGRYEEVLDLLDALPDQIRYTRTVALIARDCHVRMGNITLALREVNRALHRSDNPDLRAQARLLEGRIREMDIRWLPQIALPLPVATEQRSGRVLHVIKESLPFFERGYTIRSQSTLLAQKDAGFEPIAVTSLGFPRHYGFKEFSVHERIDGIDHYRLDLGPEYDLPGIPLDLQLDDHATMLARLADNLRPEVIQAGSGYRGYETALVALAVAQRLDVPFIYEFRSHLEHTWTGEIERSEAGEQYEGRRRQELRCLTEANGVITIAEAMRDELIELGVPGDKIRVVPNVVDVKRFTPRAPDSELQHRYGLRGRKVIGYISNLGKREGIDNLIRAVALLRAGGQDVVGLVAGDGPEMEPLAALVAELGLQRDFVLTGHIPNEQIVDHYALIDVFVVPRIDDKAARLVTPLKPLEAMAMMRPVVGADLPALREMITAGERGELFPPGDYEALASLLSELLQDEARRRELGLAGRRWVEQERTVEANAERYRLVLDAIRGA
jgi:glycosyltransferase involved in cell wall biosynthesis